MPKYLKATIELLVDVEPTEQANKDAFPEPDDDLRIDFASDVINETLRNNLRNWNKDSDVIDYRVLSGPEPTNGADFEYAEVEG